VAIARTTLLTKAHPGRSHVQLPRGPAYPVWLVILALAYAALCAALVFLEQEVKL
jgi:hypothetical protein